MPPDKLAQFRGMLRAGGNGPPHGGIGGDNLAGGGFGGGDNIGGGGMPRGGGMGPWEQSVENRIGRIEDRLSVVETTLATLTERVSHLPTKTWMGITAGGIVTALTAVIAFAEKIQGWVN